MAARHKRVKARALRAARVSDDRSDLFRSAVADARQATNQNGIAWDARLIRGGYAAGFNPATGQEFGVHLNSKIEGGKVVSLRPAPAKPSVPVVTITRGGRVTKALNKRLAKAARAEARQAKAIEREAAKASRPIAQAKPRTTGTLRLRAKDVVTDLSKGHLSLADLYPETV